MTTNDKVQQAAQEALELAHKWEQEGLIVTTNRLPLQPLAMGNHIACVEVRTKREIA